VASNHHVPLRAIKERLPIAGAACLVLALGLASRYGLSGWAAKYFGVALWSTLVYTLVVLMRPSVRPAVAAAVALAIGFAVEFAQLTPGPAWLSSKHLILRLVFGTTFSAYDLPALVAGVALGAMTHLAVARIIKDMKPQRHEDTKKN